MSAALVAMLGVVSGYNGSRVISGLDLKVERGEAVALIGRNGMGKTTALNTMFGLVPMIAGRLFVKGEELTGALPHRIANAGLGYVPEGRQIFPRLTAEENLLATRRGGANPRWDARLIYRLFPQLAAKRKNLGCQLSGGEQQMLAIGRALMTNPELLVLDEATEGLAPLVRQEIWAVLSTLKKQGLAILIVDKDLAALSRLIDRFVVLEKGERIWVGTSGELAADRARVEGFLGV